MFYFFCDKVGEKLYIGVLIFGLFFTSKLQAQKETYNWHFGENAGLNFNGKTVKALNDSKMSTIEGVSSISDKDGKLLFYTNGEKVWDRTNNLMLNGINLYGSYTTSQSALIVPIPSNDSLYYLFTLGAHGGDFNYSIVNVRRNNGLGEVTSKNVLLLNSCTEKLVAARHSNGIDIWVTVHKFIDEEFYSYLVTSSGIQPPVISQVGTDIYGGGSQGYMKISHDNTRLVLIAAETYGIVELFDFDNSTGVVNNPILIYKGGTGNPNLENTYGAEFSPNNKLLYLTWSSVVSLSQVNFHISQFDISTNLPIDVRNSKIDLLSINTGIFKSSTALQLGPDKRIYFSVFDSDYLGLIEFPNTNGIGCNVITNGIYLEGGKCKLGMPNLVPYLFDCESSESLTTDTTLCFGLETKIGNYVNDTISYTWQDGSINPFYEVSSQGIYWVQKGRWGCYTTDTFNVNYRPEIKVNLGEDQQHCYGYKTEFDVYNSDATYKWQDGSVMSSYSAEISGDYSVTVTKDGCAVSDTVKVDYKLCCDQLLLPNLVTLNSDKKNDELQIQKLPSGQTTFQIFNSWGDRIYEDRKFNGRWKPENISDGVYYYILIDNTSENYCNSWVHLVR